MRKNRLDFQKTLRLSFLYLMRQSYCFAALFFKKRFFSLKFKIQPGKYGKISILFLIKCFKKLKNFLSEEEKYFVSSLCSFFSTFCKSTANFTNLGFIHTYPKLKLTYHIYIKYFLNKKLRDLEN